MTSVPPTQPPAAPESDARLTEAEREAWDVDPDLWPHTPPLHIFRALMDEDDNVWWRASGGHGLNAYDAAIERIDELAERVRVVEGERDDLASRIACVMEASYWDRGYDERIAAIRGMCDLDTNGMMPEGVDWKARAESAEAAHRALQAAVEALADGDLWEHADALRALLAGGEER